MYCPNCGNKTEENDNFCRFCGKDLRVEIKSSSDTEVTEDIPEIVEHKNKFSYDGEELVLYEVKKHWIALFWPAFLTPVFIVYFLTKFLNSNSLFSWIILFGLLVLIIYPILRYKSDSIVVTTKFVHIKMGVINPIEKAILLNKIDLFDVTQSSMGRMLNYGTLSFCINSQRYEYPYIEEPEEMQYIIQNPEKFLKESLEEN